MAARGLSEAKPLWRSEGGRENASLGAHGEGLHRPKACRRAMASLEARGREGGRWMIYTRWLPEACQRQSLSGGQREGGREGECLQGAHGEGLRRPRACRRAMASLEGGRGGGREGIAGERVWRRGEEGERRTQGRI